MSKRNQYNIKKAIKLVIVLMLFSMAIVGCKDKKEKSKEKHGQIIKEIEESKETPQIIVIKDDSSEASNNKIEENVETPTDTRKQDDTGISEEVSEKEKSEEKEDEKEIEDQEKEQDAKIEVEVAKMDDKDDPMSANSTDGKGEGTAVEIKEPLKVDNQNEIEGMVLGIDVAKWQGNIDWNQVAASGIGFAMVRVGYRAESTGIIYEDPCAKYNLQKASAAGIKLGAYFYSTAINEQEAVEEATWVSSFIAQYPITYPVAYNCENYSSPGSRQNSLTKEQRTKIAEAFLNTVKGYGYEPMFYASKGELEGSRDWSTESLSSKYKMWVAWYPEIPFPVTVNPTYSGKYHMWQYTSKGTIPGIKKGCDVNVSYFGYTQSATAKDTSTPVEIVEADPEVGIKFTEVNETVTAKNETNLRSIPSSQSDDTIVAKLVKGDTATRTGIGNNGWARVIYNGQKLYAINSYLTTDFDYQNQTISASPQPENEFVPVNDLVTPKIQSNLRTEPHTDSDDTIAVVINNGEVLTRTGISSKGWSRIDYNGQTLYAVSSYLIGVE